MRRAPGFHDLVVDRRGLARWRGRVYSCAIGRGAFVREKREGDGAAPLGAFRLERALFRADRLAPPNTSLPLRPIRVGDGWSDDPEDDAYNQPVRLPHRHRAEAMRRADPLYDLVVVFSANRDPIEPGRGSALFLHVWRKPRHPTAGCVAFRRRDLLAILRGWTPRARLVLRG